ncbi:MAG: CaiB/BaiF CoA transferase family protein [Candidatus Rokuibacteriota bacterium]
MSERHRPARRRQPPASGRRGPLAGLRVVDCTHMLAGPYCTWLLGALGADVVKVEVPGRGDFTRSVAPFLDGQSVYFLSVNRNKRSLTLDLKSEQGKALFLRLVRTADVLVENNRPGVMARLGLDYERLAGVNPRLVYASVSGFGQTGPAHTKPAFDVVVQALSGLMSITGESDRPPARVGTSIGDLGASLFAAVGILAALQERSRTGRGTQVDVAMLDCQLALLENAVARFLNAGDVPQRLGSRHPLVAPFQAFPTSDEPIVVCVDTEEQWTRLCHVLERPALLEDPRFVDGNARVRNHAALEPILVEIFHSRSRKEWLAALEAADVPCGAIHSIPEAVQDAQVVARGMIVEVRGDGPTGRFAAVPIRSPAVDPGGETPAPRLGEHTAVILEELGLSADAIAALRRGGVV